MSEHPKVIPIYVQTEGGNDLEQSLFEVRKKIYPKAVSGWFAGWRWGLVFLTQAIFYITPWLVWNDRQGVLFDLGVRKFYIFGIIFWPQDFIYLTILLLISAYSLFLFTAVAGRLWCGYACPQTVYTEIFLWVERKIEGDRVSRMRLDSAKLSVKKVILKTAKHTVWILIAFWTGFTFVAYFTPVAELQRDFLNLSPNPWDLFWVAFYGLATYGNAGWLREQVCKYMCPYARFQSVMFDRDTLVVAYDENRGEPRGSRSKKADVQALKLGSCVDCKICVQVCPTGIDIRQGLQYECIGCSACIDGCNQVMDKMGYARGLIRYASSNGLSKSLGWLAMLRRVFRPRIIVYTVLLWAIIIATAVSLYLRVPVKVNVIRDRSTLSREVAGGLIENVYRLQMMNTQEVQQELSLSASGIVGLTTSGLSMPILLPPASTQMITVQLRAPAESARKGANPIVFHITPTNANANSSAFSLNEKSIFFKQ